MCPAARTRDHCCVFEVIGGFVCCISSNSESNHNPNRLPTIPVRPSQESGAGVNVRARAERMSKLGTYQYVESVQTES